MAVLRFPNHLHVINYLQKIDAIFCGFLFFFDTEFIVNTALAIDTINPLTVASESHQEERAEVISIHQLMLKGGCFSELSLMGLPSLPVFPEASCELIEMKATTVPELVISTTSNGLCISEEMLQELSPVLALDFE